MGTLNIANSTLSGNHADGGGGAFVSDGTFVNTLVSGNQAGRGAGIFANGSLTMIGGQVTGNGDATTTSQGGDIEADGPLMLTGTRIDHNTANNVGGGLFADIRNDEADRLMRVEIDHNGATTAGPNVTFGGGINSEGRLDLVDSYVTTTPPSRPRSAARVAASGSSRATTAPTATRSR